MRSDDGCEGEVRILSEISGRQKRCNIEHGNDKFVRRDGVYRNCLRGIAKLWGMSSLDLLREAGRTSFGA